MCETSAEQQLALEQRFRAIFMTQEKVYGVLWYLAASFSGACHEHVAGPDAFAERAHHPAFGTWSFPTEEDVRRARHEFEGALMVAKALGYEVKASWRHYLSPFPEEGWVEEEATARFAKAS